MQYDLNCIFCKYKNSKDVCNEVIHEDGWHCPSVSNIFYGKVIKLPIIKQIYNFIDNIAYKINSKMMDAYYMSETETQDYNFIFGIKSYDDLSGSSKANVFTMNDLDLIYLKEEKKYVLGIETIYLFTSPEGQYGYMKQLLDEFTTFMKENNYNTDHKLDLYLVFTEGININTHFSSIEEAYAAFKMLVNGFVLFKTDETN